MSFSKIPARLPRPFKFELSWFLHKDLYNIVNNVWHKFFPGRTFEDFWQNRANFFRKQLKGWHINLKGATKKLKKELSDHIDRIDRASETIGLSIENRNFKHSLELRLDLISKEEEIMWFQRSKEQDLLEGDNNTAYFMARASGKKRKTNFFSLNQEEGMILGDKHILDYATAFYKKLFGPNDSLSLYLDIPVNNVLDDNDRQMLAAEFSLDEIKGAVFSMRRNRAPGPDGFPIEFYQKNWALVCADLFHLFKLFYAGRLNIDRFNYGNITLLPKGEGSIRFRCICLFVYLTPCLRFLLKF